MDDRGLIFTTDAILALVIFFVFSASILTYYTLPSYMGADHQELESIAADALDVMTQDGTLFAAASKYANNNTTGAETILTEELNTLIPNNTAYKLTIGSNPPLVNDKGISISKDTASRVVVISGPKSGWLGRAWYKLEEVQFEEQEINSTTTLWNFHNWLTNFDPWGSQSHLASQPYWGYGTSSRNIGFSIPNGATITGGYYLLGSCNQYNNNILANSPAFGSNVTINGATQAINNSQFTFLYRRPSVSYPMYNYRGMINSSNLNAGNNNFYVKFTSPVSDYIDNNRQGHNMPWFSIIGNYKTSITIPKGILTNTFKAQDGAGVAVPNAQDLDGDGVANEYGRTYDLSSGTLNTFTDKREISWNDMYLKNHSYSNGVPFDITNIPSSTSRGSAICTVHDVPVPSGSRIFDGYTVINAYGGVDNALVEVWNGENWVTAFNSFDINGTDYTFGDGYGNTPGTIYIGNYLRSGETNKVRITAWDNVPSSDYDLVGLVNCYSTVSYSSLPIKWENFPFDSYQYNTNKTNDNVTFVIGPDARKIILFFGLGLDSRRVAVQVKNSTSTTWKTLYNDTSIPFSLDIGDLDIVNSTKVFTATGVPGNYTTKPGTYYLRIFVDSSSSWESGDGASNPPEYSNVEIFSGTRVGVIYPKFLANMWSSSFADDPEIAQQMAKTALLNNLTASGFNVNPDDIKTEALFTGNLPNSIPVRLDLWRN